VNLPRRQFLRLAAGAVALPAVSRIARAQTYPTKSVRIVVGFAAGGGAIRVVSTPRPACPPNLRSRLIAALPAITRPFWMPVRG